MSTVCYEGQHPASIGWTSFAYSNNGPRIARFVLTIWSLSFSFTTSRELLSQFSTCSGWNDLKWVANEKKILLLLKQFHGNLRSKIPRYRKLSHSSETQYDALMHRDDLKGNNGNKSNCNKPITQQTRAVEPILVYCPRSWLNIKPTLVQVQRIVFSVYRPA